MTMVAVLVVIPKLEVQATIVSLVDVVSQDVVARVVVAKKR